jgi:hypothetical protein
VVSATPNGSAWSAGIFYDLEMGLLYLSGSAEFRCTKMEAHIVTELLPNWRGKSLSLQLHHVDGNKTNNHLENLCLLCPNCHSQTNNWTGKNKE